MISQMIAGTDFMDGMFGLFQTAMEAVTVDLLMFIALGALVLTIIIGALRVVFSYESVAMRKIRRINKYLVKNPVVTDGNLVEFHRQMKKLPRRIRDRWQLFMLEREGSPSRYLTTEYCVKRPLYNSTTINILKQTKFAIILIAILTFLFGLACGMNTAGSVSMASIVNVIMYSTFIPILVVVVGIIFCMILQARFSALNTDFYDNFTVFIRNVDKATNTMPDYVDYELLFTKKEINNGIPILREYLEKRALEEQRLLEKAKREAVEHSPYDFEDLGVNGSQLIERAVNESESFLMNKLNLQNEIAEYEKQLANAERNMDDIEREANRKLQAIKENLERLDKAISETTNRVEINYNRRQAKDEMEKKALIEKDLQSMLAKEQTTIEGYRVEIQRRKQEIEDDKNEVQIALKSEYNTFATKVYDELNAKVSEENAETIRDYENQIVQLKGRVKQLLTENEEKETQIEIQKLELENLRSYGVATQPMQQVPQQPEQFVQVEDYGNEAYNASHEEYSASDPNLIQQNYDGEYQADGQDWNQYYDENGNLIDYSQYYDENGNPIDYSQYYDENGNLIDYSQYYDENGNYIGPMEGEGYTQGEEQPVEENANVEPTDETIQLAQESEYDLNIAPQEENVEQNESEASEVPSEENQEAAAEEVENATLPLDDDNNDDNNDGDSGKELGWDMFYDEDGNLKDFGDVYGSVDEQPVEEIDESLADLQKEDNSLDALRAQLAQEAAEDAPQTELEEVQPEQPVAEEVETKEVVEEPKVEEAKAAPKPRTKKTTTSKTKSSKSTKADSKTTSKTKKSTTAKKTTASKAKSTKSKKSEAVENVKKENDDLLEIQKQIEEENEKLLKQQQELRAQIDKTLNSIESSNKKSDKQKNIAKINDLISALKIQAKEAKAKGASKKEIQAINVSVAELVQAIANYTTKK